MNEAATPFESLERAVARAGGQSAFGRICGVSQAAVWKWLQTSKPLPAEHAIAVEAETGVSRHLLRPDIYPLDPGAPTPTLPELPPAPADVASNRAPLLPLEERP